MGQVLNARSIARAEAVASLTALFAPFDADPADVERASLWLLQAELLGLPEFGVGMLRRDLDRLDAIEGSTDAAAEPPAEGRGAVAAAAIDASAAPGILALAAAVRLAEERVQLAGAAIVGIRGAGAMGVLGCAARSLALGGAIGVVAAQSPAAVAPWGATTAAIGTNPLAIGVPRAAQHPLVVDYASSPVTLAVVRRAQAEQAPLAAGLLVDRDGRPTTDPAAVGAILPDSLLGSLTGLVVELVAGVGVGGRTADARQPATRGAIVIAFDPKAAGAVDATGASARLGEDWRAAGGHLPARFDALPPSLDALPETITLTTAAAEWLASIGGGAAR
ncbi:Ldh family oxidoreductase [Agromyces allii]|uniref:Ldh family oxidoreductase n=1 Tax=Agromyces allii TaxID=393607 RepID=A0ABP5BR75_9MICO|nr:Ldh family oxidoreductase [Agromyces allii]